MAPVTDPSCQPSFLPAATVMVNQGAPASHGILTGRGLGVPRVVSLTDATRLIADGAAIRVKDDNGTVAVPEA